MVPPLEPTLYLGGIGLVVIGAAGMALAMAVLLRVCGAYKTLDVRELRQRLEAEVRDAAGIGIPGSRDGVAGERPLPEPTEGRSS